MKSPNNLGHKPIISVNDYDKIDAQYRADTDVRALSIGNAQYDEDEISLKVWRHTGEKWSRQSEELPLHRNIDLSILFLGALMTDVTSGYPKTNLREEIDRQEDVKHIKDYYKRNEKFLKPRLLELREKLNEFLV
ncbi:MAG: DUF6530 family protein [Patiriisocius sp.]|uniref:DUF6530 family protein n=1 Tax=Patiriisocius sp. TaxID=2822396 RepID=UPI003EF76E27